MPTRGAANVTKPQRHNPQSTHEKGRAMSTTTQKQHLLQQRIQRQLALAPTCAFAGNRDLEYTVVVHPA